MNRVPKTEARQGRRGLHALYILVAGLVLAGIAWLFVSPLTNTEATTQVGDKPAIEEPVATE